MYNCLAFEGEEGVVSARHVATVRLRITLNKRSFIKLLAAVIASPVISPLLARASKNKLKNWAGNLAYNTNRLYAANSLEQVTDYVQKESRLKVLGTRHCFNNIADSSHNFLSLKPMDE